MTRTYTRRNNNGNGKKTFQSLSKSQQAQLVNLYSAISSRSELATRLGKSFKDNRNLYKSLGYSTSLIFNDFWDVYQRQDIAKRIVDAPVTASWQRVPTITESEEDETLFEKEMENIIDNINLWHYLSRIDRLSGIGAYGVLLLGFNDGKELEEPVEKASELLYLRPYKENNASIQSYISDSKDPRYGLPEYYMLNVSTVGQGIQSTVELKSTKVHHSRIIHIAEELNEDDVFGTPRLQCVFNRLMDLEKVVGGGAEMWWRGAFPGLAFILDSDAEYDVDQTAGNLEDQINAYIHDLNRTLKLQGMKVQNLSPQIADPGNIVDVLITLIAGARGIPKRILVGSERGELASSQDETAWNKKIEERRENYIVPRIIRSFINRLIEVGVVPKPRDGYTVDFPDISVPSEEERARVMKTKTEALATYSNSIEASSVIPPEVFLKEFMELSQDTIDKANDIIETDMEKEEKEQEEQNKLKEEIEEELLRERKQRAKRLQDIDQFTEIAEDK